MTNSTIGKIFLVAIYFIIIIMIPLFLDYLFKLTVRKKRKTQIKYLAEQKARASGRSLVIFNDRYHGVVTNFAGDNATKEEFTGDILEILDQMANNCCVIVVAGTMEYIENPEILIDRLKNITGGDFYLIGIEKNSPRTLWDYKIVNILEKPYYLPTDKEIKWNQPNNLQIKLEKFYSYVFKILPYDFFVNDNLDNVK